MKKIGVIMTTSAILLAAGISFLAGCQKDSSKVQSPGSSGTLQRQGGKPSTPDNSLIYASDALIYGRSYTSWTIEFYKWELAFDCAHFPQNDVDGSLQDQNQNGPVFYLAGSSGTTETRSVTIPAGKSILFPLVNFEADYPCASGAQPLNQREDLYLTKQVTGVEPDMDQLSLTIDDVSITDFSGYLFTTPMFNDAANADLANCFDNCISGNIQQFVAGGYWIMLKPLSKGQHTVHFTGGASAFGFKVDVTYTITQE